MVSPFVTALRCWACNETVEPNRLWNLCPCGKPLRVEYDLAAIRRSVDRDAILRRPDDMWRWREVLPLPLDQEPVTLGEGGTPLLDAPGLASDLGVARIWIKDEALNPTGSFKARGMSAAVTMARALGATELAVPSAGNAGGDRAPRSSSNGSRSCSTKRANTPE